MAHGDIRAANGKCREEGPGVVDGVWVCNLGSELIHKDQYAFGNCECNCRQAIVERFDAPGRAARKRMDDYANVQELEELWARADGLAAKLGNQYLAGGLPWTSEEVSRSFGGAKRKLYEDTYVKIDDRGGYYCKWWPNVTAFVKIEKYTYYDKPDRLPRPIQPRTMQYRAELSRYMKEIERRMKKIILPGCEYQFLAKGACSKTLAERFRSMWERFDNPVALCLDLSKFDGTIHPRLKKLENTFYKKFSNDRNFRECLRAQEADLYTPAFSTGFNTRPKRLGEFLHGRMSGDPQTGCGNSLIMALVCRVVFDFPCEIFANGDDTNIVLDSKNLVRARECLSKFAAFGLDVREEMVCFDLYDVEWCQCRFTETSVGDRWIRNYKKVIQTLFCNPEYIPGKVKGLMREIAEAEYNQNPGIPIISPVCDWIVKNFKRSKSKFVHENNIPGHNYADFRMKDGFVLPTPLDRQRFFDSFHIDSERQVYLETQLIEELKKFDPDNYGVYHWEKNSDGTAIRLHPFSLGPMEL